MKVFSKYSAIRVGDSWFYLLRLVDTIRMLCTIVWFEAVLDWQRPIFTSVTTVIYTVLCNPTFLVKDWVWHLKDILLKARCLYVWRVP